MSGAIGDANGIDLNSASPEELDGIGGLGRERVGRIVDERPFESWEETCARSKGSAARRSTT